MARSVDDELRGAEVSSVVFVRDYIQLYLEHEGPDIRLNAITDPIVELAGTRYRKSEAGWRDALCDLINRHVTHASVVEGSEFRLDLEGEAVFLVPLDDESRVGPEALLIFGTGAWWVY